MRVCVCVCACECKGNNYHELQGELHVDLKRTRCVIFVRYMDNGRTESVQIWPCKREGSTNLSEVEEETGVLSGLGEVGEEHHQTQFQQPRVSSCLAQGLVGRGRRWSQIALL